MPTMLLLSPQTHPRKIFRPSYTPDTWQRTKSKQTYSIHHTGLFSLGTNRNTQWAQIDFVF